MKGLDRKRNRTLMAALPFLGMTAAGVLIPITFGLGPVFALVIGMVCGGLGMIGSTQCWLSLEVDAARRRVDAAFDAQEREWSESMRQLGYRGDRS